MAKDITAAEVKSLMMLSYKKYTKGEITDTKAYKENAILANILKAIEVSETEERLRRIEMALQASSIDNYDYDEE